MDRGYPRRRDEALLRAIRVDVLGVPLALRAYYRDLGVNGRHPPTNWLRAHDDRYRQ